MYLLSKVADDGELCGFLRETRPPPIAKGDQRREVGGDGVKVLNLVEGAEVDLPEKGQLINKYTYYVDEHYAAAYCLKMIIF